MAKESQPHHGPHLPNGKQSAAVASVTAALFLTGVKLAAGLYTGSLGVLSEAAHSGLDLAAAGMTLYAVRVSARPPDRRHPYGHGKVENLSALFETLLLLLTCIWIGVEAVERLLHPQPVEAPLWAAAVVFVSVLVDLGRSRMLAAAAKKHNSQALEADALHFATDVWSSLVVLAGLGVLYVAEFLPAGPLRAGLARADALAALAVSGIVLSVSLRLGRRAVDVLLDARVDADCAAVERAAASVAGVTGVLRARVRRAGPASLVDMLLGIRSGLDAGQAHDIADQARLAVRRALPGAEEVLVELRPDDASPQGLLARVQAAAAPSGIGVHDIQLRQEEEGLALDLHAELPGELSLAEAHARVTDLEGDLQRALKVARVTTHIEPERAHPNLPETTVEAAQALRSAIERTVRETSGVCGLHNLALHRSGEGYAAAFHCRMPPDTSTTCAHDAATRIEAALRAQLPELSRIIIHMEPDEMEIGRDDRS